MARPIKVSQPKSRALYCSFCGRRKHEVDALLAGSVNIAICDRCVGECVALLTRRAAQAGTIKLAFP